MPGAFNLNNDDHDYEDKLWSSESGCVICKKKTKKTKRREEKEIKKQANVVWILRLILCYSQNSLCSHISHVQ
jgi:hypothetical protein